MIDFFCWDDPKKDLDDGTNPWETEYDYFRMYVVNIVFCIFFPK